MTTGRRPSKTGRSSTGAGIAAGNPAATGAAGVLGATGQLQADGMLGTAGARRSAGTLRRSAALRTFATFARFALVGFVALAGLSLLAGCEELGLVEPIGDEPEPGDREGTYRVLVEVLLPDTDAAEELTVTVKKPDGAETPDGSELPDAETLSAEAAAETGWEFNGLYDHADPQTAYVGVSRDTTDDGTFSVRVRYWDTGTVPDETVLLDETYQDANGEVSYSFPIPPAEQGTPAE